MKAIYSFALSKISRRAGRNVIQVVAYITGQKLSNRVTGRIFGRRSTETIISHGIVGSSVGLEELFNLAEDAENRSNSVVGRHVIVALPSGMPPERMLGLLKRLADHILVVTGAPVVFALHEAAPGSPGPENPHGHLVFPTRRWHEESMTFREKFRPLGQPWQGGKIIENFREEWSKILNTGLDPGAPQVSHLSHARQGNGFIPRRHLGDHRRRAEGRTAAATGKNRDEEFNELVDDHHACLAALVALEAERGDLLKDLAKAEAAESIVPLAQSQSRSRAASLAGNAPDLVSPMSLKFETADLLEPLKPAYRGRLVSVEPEVATPSAGGVGMSASDVEIDELLLSYHPRNQLKADRPVLGPGPLTPHL
jgi:hypothetical protein